MFYSLSFSPVQSMAHGIYNAPFIVVEEIERLMALEQRKESRVLDVAAGTGWVGRELYNRGFEWVMMLSLNTLLTRLEKTHMFQIRILYSLENKVRINPITFPMSITWRRAINTLSL